MNSPEVKFQKLLALLLDVTQKSLISWTTDALTEGLFVSAVGKSTIKIASDDSDAIVLSVYNEQGQLLERFVAKIYEDTERFREAARLHEMARRQALKVDEVIDSVLGELQDRLKWE